MHKSHLLFLIFVFLYTSACNSKVKTGSDVKKQKEILAKPANDTSKITSTDNEIKTYRVKGKSLVFFMLSQKEYLQLLKHSSEYDRYDFDNLFNTFKLNAFAFKNILEKEKIVTDVTTARFFEVELRGGIISKFDRTSDEQIVGQILSDGIKKPRIEYGLIYPRELAEIIKDYFNTAPINFPVMQQIQKPDSAIKEIK